MSMGVCDGGGEGGEMDEERRVSENNTIHYEGEARDATRSTPEIHNAAMMDEAARRGVQYRESNKL